MAGKQVQIILKASDQFSDTTKKLQLELAASKIAADNFNSTVKKLSDLHPTLGVEEAKAAAKALEDAKNSADSAGRSFNTNRIAAQGFAQDLGIALPRAVTQFLARTALIGPALGAAFGGIAIVGLIETLRQVPHEFDKIVGAITGWDKKAQEAYEHFITENQKAIDSLTKFQAKMAEIGGGPSAGNAVSLQSAEADARRLATREATLRSAANRIRTGPLYERGPDGTDVLAPTTFEGMSVNQLDAEADRIGKLSKEAADKVTELRRQGVIDQAEADQKAGDELIELRKSQAEFFARATETFRNQTFGTDKEGLSPITAQSHEVITLQASTHAAVESMTKDWKELHEEEQKAGDELIKYGEYWDKQLEEFRIKPLSESIDVKGGEKAAEESAKKIIEGFKKQQEEQKKFVSSFQEEIGHLWDSFFEKGKGVLGDLAEFGKSLFRDLTRGIVQSLATSLVFGGSAGSSGGFFGKLFGGILGSGGGGLWSEAIPGISSVGGGGGLLGGLFGGGAGLGGLLINNSAAANAMGGTLGLGVAGAGPGISSGLGGALGLNGGAGLLGLGAATIPVIGAVALGLGVALASIFGHHRQAPFTRDPNDIQRTREYEFYTGATALRDAAKDIANFTHSLNTLPAGLVVKQGLPVALNSSPQFNRQITSKLNGES